MTAQGLTPEEFADRMGLNEDYVRQCCRGDVDPRTTRKRVLPDGWTARQDGRRQPWLIYKSEDLEVIEREKLSRSEFHEQLIKNGIKLDDHEIEFIEQQIERDLRFEVARRTVLAKMLQLPAPSSNEERSQQNKALGLIAKRVTNLMSDSELVQMLLHRWSLGIEINEPEDYGKHLSALDGTSAYLSTRSELKKGSQFFARIKHYYRAAAFDNTTTSVEVKFLPDGNWKIGNRGASDEAATESVLVEFGALGFKVEDLAKWLWHTEISFDEAILRGEFDQKKRKNLIHSFADSPEVIDHPARSEFLNRCQHCGKEFKDKLSNKRFCAKGDAWYSADGRKERTDCRHAHWKWLNEWLEKNSDESQSDELRSARRTEYIAKRLDDYRSHLIK